MSLRFSQKRCDLISDIYSEKRSSDIQRTRNLIGKASDSDRIHEIGISDFRVSDRIIQI